MTLIGLFIVIMDYDYRINISDCLIHRESIYFAFFFIIESFLYTIIANTSFNEGICIIHIVFTTAKIIFNLYS